MKLKKSGSNSSNSNNNNNNINIIDEKTNQTRRGSGKRKAARKLIHNIRDYLNSVRSQRNLSPIKAHNASNSYHAGSYNSRRNTQKMTLVPQ